MLTVEQKQKIVTAANDYIVEKKISQADCSLVVSINQGYLSCMLRGKFVIENKDQQTEIHDKWFLAMAQTVGHQHEKTYWDFLLTIQTKEVLTYLEDFKKHRMSGAIICKTGFGKTYTIDRFVMKNPGDTIRITVSSLHRLRDILDEITRYLGLTMAASITNTYRILQIIHEVRTRHRNGLRPMLIIDEAENLNVSVLRMIKAMYDGFADYCPIVLIGTEELDVKLARAISKKTEGMPQFYRRFKAGFRRVSNKLEFGLFFDKYKIEQPLRKLLLELCDNYGELHDYLEPVLREADLTGEKVTEERFRLYHNMPKCKP